MTQRRYRILFTALALCFASAAPTVSASWLSRDGLTLSEWLDRDVAPYLKETLTQHPRFKGEPLQIVSMDGEQARLPADQLSLDIVRRLSETLLDADGINLVWSGRKPEGPCQRAATIHYRLGVDVSEGPGRDYQVSIRALDLEDGSWVSGFGRQWQGQPSGGERRRYRQRERLPPTPGTRGTPFDEGEADLLAKQFADTLHQRLCGRVGESLRVVPVVDDDTPSIVAKVIALTGNYLAESSAITIVDDPARANAELRGKLVAIDDDLHQLWILLRPHDEDSQPLDLQAYLRVSAARAVRYAANEDDFAPRPELTQERSGPLASMSVVTPRDRRRCRSDDPWRRGARRTPASETVPVDSCFALEIESRQDAHVFLLAHDRNDRVVRLLPNGCDRYGTVSTFVRDGRALRFPSPHDGKKHAFAGSEDSEFEVFYVVAIAERAAADAVLEQVLGTNDFCGRSGGSRASLAILRQTIADLGPLASWRQIRIIYAPDALHATR